jgi:dihydropteroate synthase/2-amino-4-hydroxy-6-hydroxymethyldihydropteridine diphosphokinase
MTRVYLGLGSNLGDRYGRLIEALDRLQAHVTIDAISSIYETEPWGYADQPCFLNAVCGGETELSARDLLGCAKAIETELGREPTFRYGPRAIDIDILLYDSDVIEQDHIQVPHPHLHERDFVLAPLNEIAPEVLHPRLEKTIEALSVVLDLTQVQVFARRPLRLGARWLHWGRQTYVMGILNVTPDSFSGDGLLKKEDWLAAVVDQGRAMIAAGAHILDVGGESTRPGSEVVPSEVELERVIPAIHALSETGLGPISIDTYKAAVAYEALEAGAVLVNDVWGLRRDENMADLIAERGVPVILMHNRSKPQDAAFEARLGGRYTGSQYDDLIPDIQRELQECVDLARVAGVPDHLIIIDPGIGFGKTVAQNLELLDRVGELKALGFPILIGPSRKSFIGYTLDLPPDQRIEGTAAAVAISIARGADIVRVHDVEPLARVAKMTDAIVRR